MAERYFLTHSEESGLFFTHVPKDFTSEDVKAVFILVEMRNRSRDKPLRQDSIDSEGQSNWSASTGETDLYQSSLVQDRGSTESGEEGDEEDETEEIIEPKAELFPKSSSFNKVDKFNKRGIKTPRPMNAYMLFSKKNRPIVSKYLANNEVAKGSRILGEWWHSLSSPHKKSYIKSSKRIQDMHYELYDHFEWTDTDDSSVRKADEDRFVKQVYKAVNFENLFKRLPVYNPLAKNQL